MQLSAMNEITRKKGVKIDGVIWNEKYTQLLMFMGVSCIGWVACYFGI